RPRCIGKPLGDLRVPPQSRHEAIDHTADDVLAAAAEQALRGPVGEDDGAVLVGDGDRVRGEFEEAAETNFAPLNSQLMPPPRRPLPGGRERYRGEEQHEAGRTEEPRSPELRRARLEHGGRLLTEEYERVGGAAALGRTVARAREGKANIAVQVAAEIEAPGRAARVDPLPRDGIIVGEGWHRLAGRYRWPFGAALGSHQPVAVAI